jgi:hypothetical protein
MSFSRRVLHMDPCPSPAPSQAHRRDGTPAFAPSCPAAAANLMCLMILIRAPCVPVPTGTHGEPRVMTDRNSLTVHGSTSLLKPRASPLLCKAVLRPLSGATSASAARSIQNMPSPGGQDSGMADTSAKPGSVGGLGAASRRPPRGLPRGSPGAGLATRPAVSRDAAPGEPRGRAMPGRRDATRAPRVEELSVPAPPSPDIRRTLKSPVNTPSQWPARAESPWTGSASGRLWAVSANETTLNDEIRR